MAFLTASRLCLSAPLLLFSLACGGDSDGRASSASASGITDSGTSGGTETGDASGGTADTGTSADTGGTCVEPCEDGECIDGACCPTEAVCDGVCCGEGQVCSFLQCVVPGATCVDASECAEDEYCEYSLGEPGEEGGMGMCEGGVSLATGKCLPQPPLCPEGQEPGDELDCLPQCEVIPEGTFDPEVKYHWTGGDSMMAPIVLPLDDDNCDNIADERDIPEIVFATFAGGDYNNAGTLRAISIIDGQIVDKWSAFPAADQINPGRSIAGGDIDASPGNEIVVCTNTGKVRAYDHDGAELWTSAYTGGCFMPSIADLDQDGAPEIVVEAGVLDGATGQTEATYASQGSVTAADLDDDGFLEVVGPHTAYEADGTTIASTGLGGRHPAVADFDGDGSAEVAVIDFDTHTLLMWRLGPGGVEIIRQGIDINGGLAPCQGGTGGGPPTIADFDGDGTPDVGVAAGVGYAVFDGASLLTPAVANADTLMWLTPAVDCSSRQTGSSVFDFDGDGSAEVVYGDEQYLRIYDGSTGTVLFETCNTTGTLWEYPLVADVDSDGHADIVAVSNSYSSIVCPADNSKQQGVRIFGDTVGKWVRTRRVWNQHPYHVTNVEEDGTIPVAETANWTVPRLNNFRQNVQPEGEFAAPDLVVTPLPYCAPGEYGIIARVRNIGQAAVPAGVPLGFYAGDPTAGGMLLGNGVTSKALYPAEAEDVLLMVEAPDLQNGSTEVWIVVDDGMPAHPWKECRTDNNTAHAKVPCAGPG